MSMSQQQSATLNVKNEFVAAVAEGVNVLMSRCGFSRDRATAALLRELSRNVRVEEEKVYATMKKENIGLDEATKLVTVSKALENAIARYGEPIDAIRNLTSRISLSNLLYESDEDPSSSNIEHDIATVASSPRAGVKITDIPISSRSKPFGVSTRKWKTPSRHSKHHRSKSLVGGRKRTIEEMEVVPSTPPANITTTPKTTATTSAGRERSDSISAEVSAKIAKKSGDENTEPPNRTPSPAAAASSRMKRTHRGDDAASPTAQMQPLKRKRTTSDI